LHHQPGTTLTGYLLETALTNVLSGHKDEGQYMQNVYERSAGSCDWAYSGGVRLTEESKRNTLASAANLSVAWREHWNISKPYLMERTPQNMVCAGSWRTAGGPRAANPTLTPIPWLQVKMPFLGSLFPRSQFVIVVRHPLSTNVYWPRWNGCGRNRTDEAKKLRQKRRKKFREGETDPDRTPSKVVRTEIRTRTFDELPHGRHGRRPLPGVRGNLRNNEAMKLLDRRRLELLADPEEGGATMAEMLVRHLDHWLYAHRTALTDAARPHVHAHFIMFETFIKNVTNHEDYASWLVHGGAEDGDGGHGGRRLASEGGTVIRAQPPQRRLNFRGNIPKLGVDTEVAIDERALNSWKKNWDSHWASAKGLAPFIDAYEPIIGDYGYSLLNANVARPHFLKRLVAAHLSGKTAFEPSSWWATLPDLGVPHASTLGLWRAAETPGW
jgi:hypothetical protein